MPKLNTANPEVKNYLLKVATYWIEEFNIDAWRLDVANEIDHQFWKDFRKAVLAKNPDLYILGEVWHTSQPWLNGDEFHAVMNYPLSDSIKDYFLRGIKNTDQFIDEINGESMYYKQQISEVMFNLLDSHDTESESCGRPMKMFNWLNQPQPFSFYKKEHRAFITEPSQP